MDDQQGNVIDGTARARQWRLARSKTHAVTDGAEARSDAPKSIAGSLLVPADMLPVASPGDQRPNGDRQSRTLEQPPLHGAVTADRGADEDPVHQNPFLLPDTAAVASVGQGTRPARRRLIAALFTRSVGAADEIGVARPSGPRIALGGDVEQAARRAKRWATMGKHAGDCSHHLRLGRAVIVSAVLLSVAAVSVIGIASQTNSTAAGPRRASVAAATPRPDAGVGTATKSVIGALGALEHHVRTSRARYHAVQTHRRPREKSRARPRHVSQQPSVGRRRSSPPFTARASAPSTSARSTSSSSPAYSPPASSVPAPAASAPSEPAPTTTTSAPQPAGPSGLGGTVGSNCNPKCS
jgi:hypothetical protein